MAIFAQMDSGLETFLANVKEFQSDHGPVASDIWFAARLPVHAFIQEQCPICHQLSVRDRWTEDNFKNEFDREKERLAIQSSPPQHMLTSDPIEGMYDIPASDSIRVTPADVLMRRAELVEAQRSVKSSFCMLESAAKNAMDHQWLLSLLSLLIFESQWLRNPPLSSLELRHIIAEKCVQNIREYAFAKGNRSDQAKYIIGLRILSKALYAEHFNMLLASVNDDDTCARRSCHAVISLTQHYRR
jgi:hypothetical protein